MRIIDKRKDYYDYIQRYGLDPAITYERKSDSFDLEVIFKNVLQKININLTIYVKLTNFSPTT